jgi:hypothetical protein
MNSGFRSIRRCSSRLRLRRLSTSTASRRPSAARAIWGILTAVICSVRRTIDGLNGWVPGAMGRPGWPVVVAHKKTREAREGFASFLFEAGILVGRRQPNNLSKYLILYRVLLILYFIYPNKYPQVHLAACGPGKSGCDAACHSVVDESISADSSSNNVFTSTPSASAMVWIASSDGFAFPVSTFPM